MWQGPGSQHDAGDTWPLGQQLQEVGLGCRRKGPCDQASLGDSGLHQGKQVFLPTSLTDRDMLILIYRVNLREDALCKGSQINLITELILWGHFQSAFNDLYLQKCYQEDGPPKSQAEYEQNAQSASDYTQAKPCSREAEIKGGKGGPCTIPPPSRAPHSSHAHVPTRMRGRRRTAIPAESEITAPSFPCRDPAGAAAGAATSWPPR